MKYICIRLIRFYQKYISPQKKKPCCRFYPSCSSYALQAFTLRGFFVGMILTVSRILRCQPLCTGGYDPVPLRGLSHPKNSRGEKIFYTLPENNRFVFTYYFPLDNDSQVQKIHERTI